MPGSRWTRCLLLSLGNGLNVAVDGHAAETCSVSMRHQEQMRAAEIMQVLCEY